MGRSFPYSLRDQVAVTERDRVLGFHGMRSGEMAEEGKESKADDNTRREKAYLPGPYLSAVRPMNPIAQKRQFQSERTFRHGWAYLPGPYSSHLSPVTPPRSLSPAVPLRCNALPPTIGL